MRCLDRNPFLQIALAGLLALASCGEKDAIDSPNIEPVDETGATTVPEPPSEPIPSRDFREQVAMRDGVLLDTHVILPPEGEGPWPTLLLRSPYLLAGTESVVSIFRAFTDEGYALVVQSCRGTAASGGTLRPLMQEFPDGQDSVGWLVDQPWSNGRVGTFGASYEGFTAGAAAIGSPAVQVVVMDGAITRAFSGWPGQRGTQAASGMLMWRAWVEGLEDPWYDPSFAALVTNSRPIEDHDLAYYGEEVEIWRDLVPQLDRASAFWDERSLEGSIGALCIPALHIQAAQEWDDDPLAAFLDSQGSECSAAERAQQRFVLGNHWHAGALYDPFGASPSSTLVRQYFSTWLKDEDVGLVEEPRVQYYLTGADTWGGGSTWPPSAGSIELPLYDPDVPEADSMELSVDPAVDDPCDPLYDKYRTLVSDPLTQDIDLVGRPEVHLLVETDSPDADIFASLYDLSPTGTYQWMHASRLRLRYRDSYEAPAAMTAGVAEQVHIDLPAIAMRIPQGHQLLLSLSGAECGTAENTHTGGPIIGETEARPAVIRIHKDASSPLLRLPVLDE